MKAKQKLLRCSCGYGDGPDHVLSEGRCCRKLATGSLVPTNFRSRNGAMVCDVNGYTITEYTLLHQRCYSQLSTGEWSLPKHEKSINSLTG